MDIVQFLMRKQERFFLVTEEHISKGIVRILKRDEEIIGFYGIVTHNEGGNEMNILSHLFLIPEEIGKGYGKILFNEAMRAAREELHWSGLLWESDPNAAWFYKKMGAKMIGRNLCPLNPDHRAPVFIFILDR
ncbi:MAG: GNAT family N-acetyltransferase [Chlamydiales bacterium]